MLVILDTLADCFSSIQGETGPSGPSGAPGSRGAPVSIVSLFVLYAQYTPNNWFVSRAELGLAKIML